LDNIIFIVLGTFVFSFAIAYVSVLKKLSKITQEFAKLYISHQSLQEFVEKNNIEFKSDSDIHKENFIKFLSDSRDWAFTYIEDVQKGLEKFMLNVEPELINFNEYKDNYKETEYYNFMTRFSKEYNDLKNFMPTDNVEKNNL
jgi:hypothetical protein